MSLVLLADEHPVSARAAAIDATKIAPAQLDEVVLYLCARILGRADMLDAMCAASLSFARVRAAPLGGLKADMMAAITDGALDPRLEVPHPSRTAQTHLFYPFASPWIMVPLCAGGMELCMSTAASRLASGGSASTNESNSATVIRAPPCPARATILARFRKAACISLALAFYRDNDEWCRRDFGVCTKRLRGTRDRALARAWFKTREMVGAPPEVSPEYRYTRSRKRKRVAVAAASDAKGDNEMTFS